jgi:hypothetical protein
MAPNPPHGNSTNLVAQLMLPRWSHKKVLRRNQAAGIIPPAQGIPGRCDAIHGAISTILLKPLPRLNSPRAVLPITLCQSPIPTWLPCNPSRHCDCARCHPGPVPVDKLATCQAGTRRGEGVFSPQTWRMEWRCSKTIQTTNCLSVFLSFRLNLNLNLFSLAFPRSCSQEKNGSPLTRYPQ